MNIDSIKNGIVIDHIEAGKGMKIYEALHLDELQCSVAIITNARSKKTGKKDILKIDNKMDIDLKILGYIAPEVTINVVENDKIVKKFNLELPLEITNVAFCKNPRCITSVERELDHVFVLTDKLNRVYRCKYCEASLNEMSAT